MKTVVIYKTTSNFTKRYAEWISEELKADIFPHSQMTIDRMLGYDIIIYGGSLHVAGVSGVDLIRKNLGNLSGKKLLVFTTGASPYSKKVEDEVKDRNFTQEQQANLRFFYLRGGYDHNKLDLKNKLLMNLLRMKIQMKPKNARSLQASAGCCQEGEPEGPIGICKGYWMMQPLETYRIVRLDDKLYGAFNFPHFSNRPSFCWIRWVRPSSSFSGDAIASG